MVFGEMERVFKLKVRASEEDDVAIVPGMLPPANSISKQRKPIQYPYLKTSNEASQNIGRCFHPYIMGTYGKLMKS